VDWKSIRRVDIALAVLAAVVQIGVTARLAPHHEHVRALDVYGYLLLAAGPVALLVRRRQPVPVLMLAFATTLGYVLLAIPAAPIWVGLIVAFGTALMSGHRIAAYGSLLAGYLGFLWLPVLTAASRCRRPGPREGSRPGCSAAGRGRADPQPAGLRPGQQAAGDRGAALGARGGPAAGQRGAARHRPGPARRGGAQPVADQRAGRGWRWS
jgi:hypothetical protein